MPLLETSEPTPINPVNHGFFKHLSCGYNAADLSFSGQKRKLGSVTKLPFLAFPLFFPVRLWYFEIRDHRPRRRDAAS